MPAYCHACGVAVLDEASYCHHCGQPLTNPAVMAPPAVGNGTTASAAPHPAEEADTAGAQAMERGTALPADALLWEGTYSAKSLLAGWLIAVFVTCGITVSAVAAMNVHRGLMVGLLCGALCLGSLGLYAMYRKLSAHYVLMAEQFVHEEGILRRVSNRVETIDIDDVAFDQGLFERLTGVGTVKIMSSDRSHPELFLEGIDRVRHVAKMIDDARRAERQRRGLFIEAV